MSGVLLFVSGFFLAYCLVNRKLKGYQTAVQEVFSILVSRAYLLGQSEGVPGLVGIRSHECRNASGELNVNKLSLILCNDLMCQAVLYQRSQGRTKR